MAVKIHYLDASATVKLFVEEDGSDILRNYFNDRSVFQTISLCFAEALGALKVKNRKNLSGEPYLSASEELYISAYGHAIQID